MSERLARGTRMRFTGDPDSFEGMPVGTLGTLLEDDGSHLPYRVTFDEGPGVPEWMSESYGLWIYARDVELADPPPQVWKQVVPNEPGPEVKQVSPVDSPARVYTRHDDGYEVVWISESGARVVWSDLMNAWVEGVRDVTRSDQETALDWFRENPGYMLTVPSTRDRAYTLINALLWEDK